MSEHKLIDTPAQYNVKPRLTLIIRGHVQPYTRMTQRGKYVDDRAKLYAASQEAIAWQIKEQANGFRFPDQTPLRIKIDYETPRLHTGDLSNILKAIEDAAQGVIFRNDCWIDDIIATRRKGEEYRAVVRIEVI